MLSRQNGGHQISDAHRSMPPTADRLSRQSGDPALRAPLAAWNAAPDKQRTAWATAYGDALAKAPDGDPARIARGDYGPVPALVAGFLALARSGGLEGELTDAGCPLPLPGRGQLPGPPPREPRSSLCIPVLPAAEVMNPP